MLSVFFVFIVRICCFGVDFAMCFCWLVLRCCVCSFGLHNFDYDFFISVTHFTCFVYKYDFIDFFIKVTGTSLSSGTSCPFQTTPPSRFGNNGYLCGNAFA